MKLRQRIITIGMAAMMLGGTVTTASILPNTVITSVVSAAETGQLYTITASDWLALRSGDSTNYTLLAKIPKGTVVSVTKYNSNKSWGYTTYDGKSGWICLLAYAKKYESTPISNGTYCIFPSQNQKQSVGVAQQKKTDKANVLIWGHNATLNRQWKIERYSGQWYKITNVNSGKVLDVAGGSDKGGTNVWQYSWNASAAQLWRFIPAGNGYYYVQSKLGNYLDVAHGKAIEGANIQTWYFNGSAAQKFKLTGINPVPTTTEAKIKAQQTTIKNYALKKVGTKYTNGMCLGFVESVYVNSGFNKNVGISKPGNDCAYYSAVKWRKSAWKTANTWAKSGGIPIGATVYIDNNSYCGVKCKTHKTWCDHVGIYVGGGYVVHASGGVIKKEKLTKWGNMNVSWGFAGVKTSNYSSNSLTK